MVQYGHLRLHVATEHWQGGQSTLRHDVTWFLKPRSEKENTKYLYAENTKYLYDTFMLYIELIKIWMNCPK